MRMGVPHLLKPFKGPYINNTKGEGGVSNMLTNVNKGGRGFKSMLTLARGIEVRYSKSQIFVTKFALLAVVCCFP